MRSTIVLTALFAAQAGATDFRDCKELYVYSSGAILPETKSNGAVWDEGSGADPELLARVGGRADIPWQIVGPKIQDASQKQITWSSVWPADVKTGKWLPVRVGDVLQVKLVERDAFADDAVGSGTFEIPRDVSTSGFVLAPVTAGTATIQLGVSATDGTRLCAGATGTPSDVNVAFKSDVFGRPDSAAFEIIRANNKCDLNGNTVACRESSYVAAYSDLNQDGATDLTVVGGPFAAGSSTKIVAAWLGTSPSARKELFVGECDELAVTSKTELVCVHKGKSTAVPYDGGPRKSEVVLAAASVKTKSPTGPVVVLKRLTSGDRGCYPEFQGADGKDFTIVGDFELCPGGGRDATPLIGKKVTYSTEKAKVLAASCQGDMDCGKSDVVDLVSTITAAK